MNWPASLSRRARTLALAAAVTTLALLAALASIGWRTEGSDHGHNPVRPPQPASQAPAAPAIASTNPSNRFIPAVPSAPKRAAAPQEVVVKVRRPAGAATSTGTTETVTTQTTIVKVPAGRSVESVVAERKQDPAVVEAFPNRRYYPASLPASNDPGYSELWGLNNSSDIDIDFPEANSRQAGKRSIIVAVLDTGVDFNHPDLKSSIFTNSAELNGKFDVDDDGNGCIDDVHGCNIITRSGSAYVGPEKDFHGTHVAGTISATANNSAGITGVAPNITILPVKILDEEFGGTTYDAVAGIEYAKRMGAKIINASWGGPDTDTYLRNAIGASGLLVVAAAGNEGTNIDSTSFYPASLDLSNILSVAAIGKDGSLPSWSNRGATGVDVAAPGVNILSTAPGNAYAYESGTSMATPHVSAIAALQASKYASWDPAKAVTSLKDAVQKRSSLTGKVSTGGVINAAYALGMWPVTTLRGSWRSDILTVRWVNPKDSAFTKTVIRYAPGHSIPSPTGGTQVYTGTGTSARLPKLRAGYDYTVAAYSYDASGPRPVVVLRVSATTITRLSSTTSLAMRLSKKNDGTVLGGRAVELVRVSSTGAASVLCRRTTDYRGRASCPLTRGSLQWRYASSGTYLLRSSSSFTR